MVVGVVVVAVVGSCAGWVGFVCIVFSAGCERKTVSNVFGVVARRQYLGWMGCVCDNNNNKYSSYHESSKESMPHYQMSLLKKQTTK